MKTWPNEKTDWRGVSPEEKRRWHEAQHRIAMTSKDLEWLKKQGDFPEGEKMFLEQQAQNILDAERWRQICRRQDIEARWYLRRPWKRPLPIRIPIRWMPMAMTYDNYLDRNRRLRD